MFELSARRHLTVAIAAFHNFSYVTKLPHSSSEELVLDEDELSDDDDEESLAVAVGTLGIMSFLG